MRISEFCGLTMRDIDLEKRTINIDHLLLEYAGEARDIADPWYTGNFDVTYEDVKEGCEAFLQYLIENEPLY